MKVSLTAYFKSTNMRVPIRKGNNRIFVSKDYYISPKKYLEIEQEIKRLKNKRPALASEVKRLAEMGDFSENAAYQLAKGRLRGLNQRILDLSDRLKKAEIIENNSNLNIIQIGHTVKLKIKEEHKTYTILGASESNPSQGIISHLSPLGSLLLGKKVGDIIKLKDREYKVLDIIN